MQKWCITQRRQKRAVAEIDTEKVRDLTFGENVLADTHAFELHITEKKDLEGLPDQVKEMAVEMAQSKAKQVGCLPGSSQLYFLL